MPKTHRRISWESGLEMGATAAEILETCAVVISMGGNLAWSKTLYGADSLQEHGLLKM